MTRSGYNISKAAAFLPRTNAEWPAGAAHCNTRRRPSLEVLAQTENSGSSPIHIHLTLLLCSSLNARRLENGARGAGAWGCCAWIWYLQNSEPQPETTRAGASRQPLSTVTAPAPESCPKLPLLALFPTPTPSWIA